MIATNKIAKLDNFRKQFWACYEVPDELLANSGKLSFYLLGGCRIAQDAGEKCAYLDGMNSIMELCPEPTLTSGCR